MAAADMDVTGDEEAAARFKQEGNKAFMAGHFAQAVDLYSKSLHEHSTVAVLTNRAAAYLKLEDFGLVIADATMALEKDPRWPKAYYRRASAYVALGQLKKARRDFRTVVKLLPTDEGAKARVAEVDKQIKRKAFEAAITVDSTASVWERVPPESFPMPTDYKGPELADLAMPMDSLVRAKGPSFEEEAARGDDEPSEWGVSANFVKELMELQRRQENLPARLMAEILARARTLFRSFPSLIRPELAPEDEIGRVSPQGSQVRFTVVGDTHGQYYDLLKIFSDDVAGLPSPRNPFLFNGDFVDRGPFSVEVITTLLAWKLCYPRSFHMLRGNHETRNMGRMYGFEGEVHHKYNPDVMAMFTDVFQSLPLAAVVGDTVFVAHGGLPERDEDGLDDIAAISRFQEPPEGGGLMSDLLWADPQPFPGRGPSKRGVGKSFGPDITTAFLKRNKLSLLIRSHEVKDDGYLVEHGGQTITVFSAPNYCDQMGNKGAVVHLDAKGKPTFTQYTESPHPPLRPMHYASGMSRLMMGMQ